MRVLECGLTAICILIASCSTTTNNSSPATSSPEAATSSQSTPNQTLTTSPPQNRLDAEAETEAKKYWDKRFASCGANFYIVKRSKGRPASYQQFYECKNQPVLIVNGQEVLERSITEAEKLNGVDPRPVEWEGNGQFIFNTCRYHYVGEPAWKPWADVVNMKFRVRRFKAQWVIDEIEQDGFIGLENVSPVDCRFVQDYFKAQKL